MLTTSLTPEHLTRSLGWIFDKVAGQVAPPEGPGTRLTDAQIDRQVALYTAMAGTAGFVSNIGGLLTLPIALPANMVGIAAIQLKLIAVIATGRGHDVGSEEVKALGLACLTGCAALKLLREAGVQAGMKLGNRALGHLSAAVLVRINQAVGFRLMATAGAAGAINLTKAVPLLGGLVGGTVDAASTRAVGAVAKRLFTAIPLPTEPAPPGTPQLPAPDPVA